jgi:hypothetical protein
MLNDLLLPIYLFAVYFAIYCWSQSTSLAVTQPALTLVKTKPKSSRPKRSTIRSVIEQAAAAA